MKRNWVIIVNVFIMIAMLTFVVLYSNYETREATQRQIEHFENTTVTMEHVTENYLEGEQRICDVWARYINSKDMTIEEAASFIRISHVLPNASAHIVYLDTLSGLSTKARQNAADDYTVSYEQMDLLNDVSWIYDIGESINISRAYTNPVNGEQSIAFCNFITLHDLETGNPQNAILLRVLLEAGKKKGLIKRQYQNNYLLNRISGFFFDIMIVAGIASINLEDLRGLWIPFILLAAAGGGVTWLHLKRVCRKVYPDYYSEGLISMYGMLTGTISSGVLLLRELDPGLSTPAANNLVIGSSYGIVLGAPILVLVGLAPKSDLMCWLTMLIAAAYLAALLILIDKAHRREKAKKK